MNSENISSLRWIAEQRSSERPPSRWSDDDAGHGTLMENPCVHVFPGKVQQVTAEKDEGVLRMSQTYGSSQRPMSQTDFSSVQC